MKKTVPSDFTIHNLSLALKELGHKPLLNNYECPRGRALLITKAHGELHFFFEYSQKENAMRITHFYLKRYGLYSVDGPGTRMHIL